jgi:hypothetical protein
MVKPSFQVKPGNNETSETGGLSRKIQPGTGKKRDTMRGNLAAKAESI